MTAMGGSYARTKAIAEALLKLPKYKFHTIELIDYGWAKNSVYVSKGSGRTYDCTRLDFSFTVKANCDSSVKVEAEKECK